MIIGIILPILGAAALIVAISFTAVSKSDGKLQGQTTGRIVDITYYPEGFNKGLGGEESVNASYSTNRQQHMAGSVYAYVVDGVEYRRTTNYLVNEGAAKKKIGQICTVRYHVSDPSVASIAKSGVFKTVAVVLYIIAFLLILAGFLLAVLL